MLAARTLMMTFYYRHLLAGELRIVVARQYREIDKDVCVYVYILFGSIDAVLSALMRTFDNSSL